MHISTILDSLANCRYEPVRELRLTGQTCRISKRVVLECFHPISPGGFINRNSWWGNSSTLQGLALISPSKTGITWKTGVPFTLLGTQMAPSVCMLKTERCWSRGDGRYQEDLTARPTSLKIHGSGSKPAKNDLHDPYGDG